jgi:hypothetical protein
VLPSGAELYSNARDSAASASANPALNRIKSPWPVKRWIFGNLRLTLQRYADDL